MPVFTVKRSDELVIGLPEDLLKQWHLREGEQITLDDLARKPRKASPEAIEAFLALEGILADAPEFEEVIAENRKEWDEWGRQLEDSVLTRDS